MTAFADLCRLTRIALGTEADPEAAIRAARLDPDAMILLAFQHRVAAFLGRLTHDPAAAPLLPATLFDAFSLAEEANGARNAMIREQLAETLARFNAAGIVPIVLKGGARLVDGTFTLSERFMEDLDLLIPEPQIAEAVAILDAAGYAPFGDESRLAEEHHHLPALWHDEWPVCLEIHRTVTHDWYPALLSASGIFEHARPVAFGGATARIASPSDSLLHLVVHAQVNHKRLLSGSVLLSEVVEFAMLARRHGMADVIAADAEARAGGVGLGFATFAHVCERSVGTPPLPRISRMARALGHRTLWQQEHPWAHRSGEALAFVAEHALSLRHRPSVRRRFPGRFGERAFYQSRWREIRRILAR